MSDAPRPAIFFDRDGTLMDEVHYCSDPADVRVISGVPRALAELRARGWLCILITNQSGIGRGLIRQDQYDAVHAEFLRQIDGQLDAAYFCADAPPGFSPRRKPEPGMILEAMADFAIQKEASWMVGDKEVDVLCGQRAGVKSMLVRTGYGNQYQGASPDGIADDAVHAVQFILGANLPSVS